MPQSGIALEKPGFLTIGLFDGDNPGPGHQTTLEMIVLGERLGFDSAWVRHRHLQYGISSPVAVLAAASQRTSRIELGTAVIPLGWENPLRLAEDLGTVDILSGGRLNPGLSVGPPMHFDDVKDSLYPDAAGAEDFNYERRRGDERARGHGTPRSSYGAIWVRIVPAEESAGVNAGRRAITTASKTRLQPRLDHPSRVIHQGSSGWSGARRHKRRLPSRADHGLQ
jgi:Luciferase-like monooxygenase